MISRKIFIFLLISLCLSSAAFAQATEATKSKETEIPAEIKEKAVDLIRKMARDAAILNLPENRLTFTIAAAGMLWQHDEQAAREIFRNSMNDIRGMILEHQQKMAAKAANADEDFNLLPDFGEENGTYADTSQLSNLREQLILTFGRFDGDAAFRFMLETRPVFAPAAGDKNSPNDYEAMMRGSYTTEDKEAGLEVKLAGVVAGNDPQKALDIATKSLSKGFSPLLDDLLAKLYAKDRERGAKLADEVLKKLKTSKLDGDDSARSIAFNLLRQGEKGLVNAAKASGSDKKPLLTESAMRELSEIIARSGLTLKGEDYQFYSYRESLDILTRYAPASAAQLKQKLNAPGDNSVNSASNPVAFEIKNETIGNSTGKKEAVDPDAPSKKIGAGGKKFTIEEIRQETGKIKNRTARLAALAQFAVGLADSGDKDLAKEVLADARKLTVVQPKYMTQYIEHLQIARAYSAVDAEKSFEMLEAIIFQLDDLIGAFIKVGEFAVGNMVIKDGEVRLSGLPMFVGMGMAQAGRGGEMGFEGFEKDIVRLAKADFNRTAALTEKFSRTEARLLARMIIIHSIFPEKDDDFILPSAHNSIEAEVVTASEKPQN